MMYTVYVKEGRPEGALNTLVMVKDEFIIRLNNRKSFRLCQGIEVLLNPRRWVKRVSSTDLILRQKYDRLPEQFNTLKDIHTYFRMVQLMEE